MINKQNQLDLAEYFFIGALFFGLITTVISKQIIYFLTPLSFYFLINTINFQKLKRQSDLSSAQSQKINILYQDLIDFSEDYKYKKLELESLVKKIASKEAEIENKIKQNTNQDINSSVLNRLSSLEYSKLELERKMQAAINTIEFHIKKIDNFEPECNIAYQSSIGQSSSLKSLTEYYPLQGLTQRLIVEIRNCQDIKYSQKTEGNKILTESNLKYVQKVAKHSLYLAEKVIGHHNDHQCSRQEAEQLSSELNQLAMEVSMIRSVYDLKIIYKVVTVLTYQISRFKHRESKYRWNRSMREKMLNVFNDCLSKV